MDKQFQSLPRRRKEQLLAFDRLLSIMDELREKCPWDKKQTMESLRPMTIEEVYELADGILEGNVEAVKKELGDVMLHLVFYARLASETQSFDIGDVLNTLSEKLIVRHPHIYGDVKVENDEQVKQNWEQIKLKEGGQSVLEGVPSSLPSLVKAVRIQEKARGAGFDWEHKEQVWEKVKEELLEFQENFDENMSIVRDQENAEQEFGDLLFSLVNFARFVNINPDNALERTNKKFMRRFSFMEQAVKSSGQNLKDLNLRQMDAIWEQAKELEKQEERL